MSRRAGPHDVSMFAPREVASASDCVAVFLTSFNRPNGLRLALASILAQTHRSLRCVILDDGSTPRPVLDELTDDERATLVCFPRRPSEYKRARCTLSQNLNEAQAFVYGCAFASYATDTNVYQPDRIERLVAGFRAVERTNPHAMLGFVWGHQATSFDPRTDPGRDVQEWPAKRLRAQLDAGNFIDYASVLEAADFATTVEWDEAGSAWPHNDWLRWKAIAARGAMAARIPVYSDFKDCSGPHEHMGQVFRRGGDVADFVERARE